MSSPSELAKELESLLFEGEFGKTEVLKNPKIKDLNNLADEDLENQVKVVKDPTNGNVFAWHGSDPVYHDEIAEQFMPDIGLTPDKKLDYQRGIFTNENGRLKNYFSSSLSNEDELPLSSSYELTDPKKLYKYAIPAAGAAGLSPDDSNASELSKELESLMVGNTEVLRNPAKRDLHKLASEEPYNTLRVLKDQDDGSTYAWKSSEKTHDDIINSLGMKGGVLTDILNMAPNGKFESSSTNKSLFDELMNSKKVAPLGVASAGASLISPDDADASTQIPVEDFISNLEKKANAKVGKQQINPNNMAQDASDASMPSFLPNPNNTNAILRSVQDQTDNNIDQLKAAFNPDNSLSKRALSALFGGIGFVGVPETALAEASYPAITDPGAATARTLALGM